MKIVLCDDEEIFLEQMTKIVKELSPNAEIYSYSSSKDLVQSNIDVYKRQLKKRICQNQSGASKADGGAD